MKHTLPVLTLAALLAALLAVTVAVGGPIVSLERAIETGSGSVLMPATDNGTLTANNCAGCRPERLNVTPQTRYYAREQALPLATLRTLLAGSAPVSMTVFVDPKSPTVLRVVADLAPPRAPTR